MNLQDIESGKSLIKKKMYKIFSFHQYSQYSGDQCIVLIKTLKG